MNRQFKFLPGKTIRRKLGVMFFIFALPHFCFSQKDGNANQPVFNHAALCARDLKKTTDFYSTVLQLQKIHHPFNDTLHTWFKIGPGLALHIIQGDCPAIHDISIHLCFSVPSLDAFIKHLDQLNVPYGNWAAEPKKIQKRADGVQQIYFKDPDGFWIEVNDAK
jgi:lactoylglutathione lyase